MVIVSSKCAEPRPKKEKHRLSVSKKSSPTPETFAIFLLVVNLFN